MRGALRSSRRTSETEEHRTETAWLAEVVRSIDEATSIVALRSDPGYEEPLIFPSRDSAPC